jgi:hypothetical protein
LTGASDDCERRLVWGAKYASWKEGEIKGNKSWEKNGE